MLSKRVWLAIFTALLVAGAIVLQWYWENSNRDAKVHSFASALHHVTDAVVEPGQRIGALAKHPNTPQVNAERLYSHIQALAFERYTDRDRTQARSYISQQLSAFGWQPVLQPFEQGVNIFAQRPGTNPQAGAILIAAHYDTVPNSPGADDNASGVAVALEVAKLLSNSPTTRSLQVAFFDQEERGLLGSRAFTDDDAHLAGLQGVIILDMVGYACYTQGCQKYPEGLPITLSNQRGDFVAVLVDQEHLSLLNAFHPAKSQNLPPLLTLPVPFKGLLTPDLLRSDHAPFWYHGIGALMMTDTANFRTPHYHQASDQPLTIDRKFLAGAAQVLVNATVALLAGES